MKKETPRPSEPETVNGIPIHPFISSIWKSVNSGRAPIVGSKDYAEPEEHKLEQRGAQIEKSF